MYSNLVIPRAIKFKRGHVPTFTVGLACCVLM